MVQLLIVLLVPPAVGLMTYFLVRLSSGRHLLAVATTMPRRRKSSRVSIFALAKKRLRNIPSGKIRSPRNNAIGLLVLGIVGGFAFGWYFF